tara:strand:+ start:55 stop:2538 length:2484 start_codon:yes stop_codon:yes gene_type:complete
MINDFTKKESPFLSLAGLGGGVSSQLFVTSAVVVGTATTVATRSLRLNSSDSAYLNRTPASAGNRKKWTWSGWMKLSKFGGDPNNFFFGAGASDEFYICQRSNQEFHIRQVTGGSEVISLITDNEFRDTGAWGNLVVAVDTGQATASNRIKVYWNGSQITSFSTATYPSQDLDTHVNNNVAHYIGKRPNGTIYLDSYLTDVYFVDGSQLSPTAFGYSDLNGIWQNHLSSESLGTNGFHLDFNDNSSSAAIGKDKSGRDNDFTVNNFNFSAGADNDSLFDAPSNGSQSDTGAGGQVSGNYATWSTLVQQKSTGTTISDGGLKTTCSGTRSTTMSTFPLRGKTYWEVTFGSGTYNYIGMTQSKGFNTQANQNSGIKYTGYQDYSYGWQQTDGKLYNASNILASPGGYSNGDVLGWAYDADNNTLKLYKNGSLQHTENSIIDAQYYPAITHSASATSTANFGQRAFAHAAPSGYKPVCTTTSIATPAITDSSDHFDLKLWTGTGSSHAITGYSFSPDFAWIKARNNAGSHALLDTVRGNSKVLRSDNDTAEQTNTSVFTSFDSNGFTLGADTSNGWTNYNTWTYVGYAWEGGSSVTPSSSGTITATTSYLNSTAGFNILKYDGIGDGSTETLGHSLSSAPEFIIIKCTSNSANWAVYHSGTGAAGATYALDTTGSRDGTSMFAGQDPTSTLIHLKENSNRVQNSGRTYIAYCWHSVPGFSKALYWDGNDNDDGTFIPMDFRPAWFIFKRDNGTANWYIYDSLRGSVNPLNANIEPNTNDAENTLSGAKVDFLSNGIKIRGTDGDINGDGGDYIGFAFAEKPFQTNGGIAR